MVSLKEVLMAATEILAYGDHYDLGASMEELARKTRPPKTGFWRLERPEVPDPGDA